MLCKFKDLKISGSEHKKRGETRLGFKKEQKAAMVSRGYMKSHEKLK